MKNVHAQRLTAATALALLTVGVPAMAERNSSVRSNVDLVANGASINDAQLLAQADAAQEEPAVGEETERQKRQRERREAQQQRQEAKQERQQQRQEAQQERQQQRQEARQAEEEAQQQQREERRKQRQQAQEQKPDQAADPASPLKSAEPASEQPAQSAEPTKSAEPAEPAAEKPARTERQKAREERRKQAQEQKPDQAADPASPPKSAEPASEQPAQSAEPAKPVEPAAEKPTRTERQKAREERRKQAQEAEQTSPLKQAQPPVDSAQPAQPAQQPADTAQPAVPVLPGSDTPLLDSQKEPQAPAEGGQPAAPAKPAGPPPASDKEAQKETVKVEDITPVTKEEGKRVEGERPRRERREGSDVLREIDGRIIIDLGGRPVVESSDRPRMTRDAREVYYEELPRGRTRETIVRPNGVQIVTVRDRYGEVIRRSRIMPDGREYVLVYVDEERRGPRDGRWRDPGADLPPLVLTIPSDEYILDAEDADDEEEYYDFLDQPPVERVERLYSVDEVKRSARVRDTVRRVDLDTITFEFGSAEIKEDAIGRLDNVAKAMERMLKENPAETFLIEGHTDAVGSDMANLALSDRRAEAVAAALTDVFEIPPENLTTQGYGEQYLKVRTDAPEERNRRVAIRRITPLVAPVASAQ